MPSAPTTTSASARAPLAKRTRAMPPASSKPTARCPQRTTPAGSAAARKATRSARCMPKVAFQPEASVTCTGAIGAPSWRKYCDFGPTRAPHFSSAGPRPTRSIWRTAFGVRYTPAPTSPSAGACSYTDTSRPCAISALAANKPPMPPPTTAICGRALFISRTSTPPRPDDVPGGAGDERERQEKKNDRGVEAAGELLDRLAGEVAEARDDEGPQHRADEIEERDAPRSDVAGADDDQGGHAQAVQEAHDEDGVNVPAAQQRLHARGAGGEAGKAGEHAVAVAAAEVEEDLVAEEAADHGDHDHCRERQVAVVRGEAGQEDDGLAFEDGADEQRQVAELRWRCSRRRRGGWSRS